MKWIRRLLAMLVGLLGCVLILACTAFFLDESAYKRVLAWSAERFLDSQLIIEGPIRVAISSDLSFSSESILLKANDDSYRLSVGSFNTSFRLGSYFRTGTFWFNSLELSDVNLEVTETSDENFTLEDVYIPPFVIGKAQVNNLEFSFQERPPGTLQSFSLSELTLGELGEYQPLSWRAVGLFEAQPYVLQGTISPLAQLIEGREPQELQLELSSGPINVNIQGTVDDPLNGRGLDLKLQYEIPQVVNIIEILGKNIPQLGSLKGSLTVRGDYVEPRFEDIDLRLQRGKEVELIIKGSIANALTGEGVDLQLDGQSNNPDILSWLLFRKYEDVQRIQVSGRLKKDMTRFSLHDVNASAETSDGLKLQLSGSAVIQLAGYQLTHSDAGLTVQFHSPTLAATKLIGMSDMQDLGPVNGSAALALSVDAVGIYNIDVGIGSLSSSQIALKGDVGYVPLSEKPLLSGLKLKTDIKTPEFAKLAKQFNLALPALDSARLRGILVSQGAELVLQDASLDIRVKDQLTLHATGMLVTQLYDPSHVNVAMDVNIRANEFARLAEPLGYRGPELGNAVITGRLESRESELLFRDAKLTIGSVEDPWIQANGILTTDVEIAQLHYKGKIALGSTHGLTEVSARLQDGKPILDGNIEIPVLHLDDFGAGLFEENISIATTDTPKVAESPYIFSREALNIEFLNTFDLDLALSIDEVESGGRVIDSVNGRLRLNNGQLSIDPLNLVFEGGNTDIKLDVLATGTPEYRLLITSDDVSLGALMAQIQDNVPIQGYSSMYLDLHTQGHSLHEMASALSGSVSVGFENAKIPRNYVEFLSIDVFGWVLSKTVSKEQYLDLNCLVMAVKVSNGDVKSETISADGDRLSISGQLNMNLGDETLDIVLIPEQKKRVFSSITPVKVVGPMRAPVITAIPAKAALQEIGAMALLPGVLVPLRMGEKLWALLDDGDKVGGGCVKVR